MNYGFVKMAAGVPEVRVADPKFNVQAIENLVIQAEGRGIEVICMPELSITGYSCGDLFAQQLLLDEAEMALIHLLNFSRSLDIITIVGLPVPYKGSLFNCAAVIQKGKILGIIPKTYLPNYHEFYEARWFASALQLRPEAEVWMCGQLVKLSSKQLFRTPTCTFGVELCEDLWSPLQPSTFQTMSGAEIVFNMSADNDVVGKQEYLKQLLRQQTASTISGYIYSSAGFGESTQDVVFSSKAYIVEDGKILAQAKPHSLEPQIVESEIDIERLRSERRQNTTFTACASQTMRSLSSNYAIIDTALIGQHQFEITRQFRANPFVPTGPDLDDRCEEVFAIQAEGLAKRLMHTKTSTAVIGISGGLDSTLALLVTVKAFDLLKLDRRGIVGVTMPGFGTTDRTYNNAVDLMHALGITMQEINISKAVMQHFDDIDHDPRVHDVTGSRTYADSHGLG